MGDLLPQPITPTVPVNGMTEPRQRGDGWSDDSALQREVTWLRERVNTLEQTLRTVDREVFRDETDEGSLRTRARRAEQRLETIEKRQQSNISTGKVFVLDMIKIVGGAILGWLFSKGLKF